MSTPDKFFKKVEADEAEMNIGCYGVMASVPQSQPEKEAAFSDLLTSVLSPAEAAEAAGTASTMASMEQKSPRLTAPQIYSHFLSIRQGLAAKKGSSETASTAASASSGSTGCAKSHVAS